MLILIQKGEGATIQGFVADMASNNWAWTEPTLIRLHKGVLIGAGSFRNAYKCCIQGSTSFNDEVYVFKTFNSESLEARAENFRILGKDMENSAILKEMNQKVCNQLSTDPVY